VVFLSAFYPPICVADSSSVIRLLIFRPLTSDLLFFSPSDFPPSDIRHPSSLLHERISIVFRRYKIFFYGAGGDPADHVQQTAGFIVGAAGAPVAKRLLPDHRPGGLVIDVKITRGIFKYLIRPVNGIAVFGKNRTGQRIGRGLTRS
jgi:hypothetical protein